MVPGLLWIHYPLPKQKVFQMKNGKRWLEHWSTQAKAQEFFRAMWKRELNAGRRHGDRIQGSSDEAMLFWLVRGHPHYPSMVREGFSHFTFAPDGRGNCRFVLIDRKGGRHPFSTLDALRGVSRPLREPDTFLEHTIGDRKK